MLLKMQLTWFSRMRAWIVAERASSPRWRERLALSPPPTKHSGPPYASGRGRPTPAHDYPRQSRDFLLDYNSRDFFSRDRFVLMSRNCAYWYGMHYCQRCLVLSENGFDNYGNFHDYTGVTKIKRVFFTPRISNSRYSDSFFAEREFLDIHKRLLVCFTFTCWVAIIYVSVEFILASRRPLERRIWEWMVIIRNAFITFCHINWDNMASRCLSNWWWLYST